MQILIQSFGYKHGIPLDADFIFDVRCLPNPFWIPHLKNLNGKDKEIIDFFLSKEISNKIIEQISNFLINIIPEFSKNDKNHINIYIGCTGGQHRSVFIAESINIKVKALCQTIIVKHRNLQTKLN